MNLIKQLKLTMLSMLWGSLTGVVLGYAYYLVIGQFSPALMDTTLGHLGHAIVGDISNGMA